MYLKRSPHVCMYEFGKIKAIHFSFIANRSEKIRENNNFDMYFRYREEKHLQWLLSKLFHFQKAFPPLARQAGRKFKFDEYSQKCQAVWLCARAHKKNINCYVLCTGIYPISILNIKYLSLFFSSRQCFP